jgi:hypothetical protein
MVRLLVDSLDGGPALPELDAEDAAVTLGKSARRLARAGHMGGHYGGVIDGPDCRVFLLGEIEVGMASSPVYNRSVDEL